MRPRDVWNRWERQAGNGRHKQKATPLRLNEAKQLFGGHLCRSAQPFLKGDPGDNKDLVEARAMEVAAQVRQADDARTRELIRVRAEHARAGRPPVHLSETQIQTLVDAVGKDLIEGADGATLDEKRLARIETQTQLLTQAVRAVTETVQTVAAAVDALHDQMQALDGRSDSADVAPPATAS